MNSLTSISELAPAHAARVVGVLCDVDDTLTWHGELVPAAFDALHRARAAGLRVVPVTGRPAGWVDHLARMWPVDGVVGENGGLWFYRDEAGRLVRRFVQDEGTRRENRARLDALAATILAAVPGCGLASDQPYRELDLAIDFCEDVVALDDAAVAAIVDHFHAAGATCKVSSIHVNGWYGAFDKLAGCGSLMQERWGFGVDEAADTWMFVGDSPNDEPMFRHFALSVGVANVARFLPSLQHKPRYVTHAVGGEGFAEAIDRLLAARAQALTGNGTG